MDREFAKISSKHLYIIKFVYYNVGKVVLQIDLNLMEVVDALSLVGGHCLFVQC